MGKFVFAWFTVSLMIGCYNYFFSKTEKRNIKQALLRIGISLLLGLSVIFAAMFLNNVSGV